MNTRSYIAAALIGSTFAAAIASSAIAAPQISPLRKTVIKFYAANDTVQRAVDLDACKGWDMLEENHTARNKLSRRDAKTYDAIAKALGAAYAASEQTDAELEEVNREFCVAVENR